MPLIYVTEFFFPSQASFVLTPFTPRWAGILCWIFWNNEGWKHLHRQIDNQAIQATELTLTALLKTLQDCSEHPLFSQCLWKQILILQIHFNSFYFTHPVSLTHHTSQHTQIQVPQAASNCYILAYRTRTASLDLLSHRHRGWCVGFFLVVCLISSKAISERQILTAFVTSTFMRTKIKSMSFSL